MSILWGSVWGSFQKGLKLLLLAKSSFPWTIIVWINNSESIRTKGSHQKLRLREVIKSYFSFTFSQRRSSHSLRKSFSWRFYREVFVGKCPEDPPTTTSSNSAGFLFKLDKMERAFELFVLILPLREASTLFRALFDKDIWVGPCSDPTTCWRKSLGAVGSQNQLTTDFLFLLLKCLIVACGQNLVWFGYLQITVQFWVWVVGDGSAEIWWAWVVCWKGPLVVLAPLVGNPNIFLYCSF